MVRQAVPLQGHDNPALTNDAGIVLRRLRRLKSNAVAPEPQGAPLESFAAPACEAEAEGISPQQETPFGAVNGTSEAKPKPSWTLPDVTLSRVKDRAMGFVRQGSSKVSVIPPSVIRVDNLLMFRVWLSSLCKPIFLH